MNQLRARHWIEYVATGVVLAVSVISLWVAIGTEDANRRMVAAASWPFLQFDSSNSDDKNVPNIALSITNSGVGPAKVQSFEVEWKGRAYSNSYSLLHACCGLDLSVYRQGRNLTKLTPIFTSNVSGIVIRAGDSRPFLSVHEGPDNTAMWRALDVARFQMHFHVCYCSVFDECWLSELKGLSPVRVDRCPVPRTPYTE